MAADESAFDRLNLLLFQDDQQAIGKMVSDGELFRVTSGTACRVIKSGDEFCEVESFGCEQAGKRGVVGSELIQ